MPISVKNINRLASVHETIKADPDEDILYCEACKNLKWNFGKYFQDKAIIKLTESSVVIYPTWFSLSKKILFHSNGKVNLNEITLINIFLLKETMWDP